MKSMKVKAEDKELIIQCFKKYPSAQKWWDFIDMSATPTYNDIDAMIDGLQDEDGMSEFRVLTKSKNDAKFEAWTQALHDVFCTISKGTKSQQSKNDKNREPDEVIADALIDCFNFLGEQGITIELSAEVSLGICLALLEEQVDRKQLIEILSPIKKFIDPLVRKAPKSKKIAKKAKKARKKG